MFDYIRRLFILIFLFSPALAFASFNSSIFAYDDPEHARGIKVTLTGQNKLGEPWVSRNVTGDDFSLLENLYGDPEVMANFGGGDVKDMNFINECLKVWTGRAQNGHPHGGWVMENKEHIALGVAMAAGNKEAGVSEIARMFLTSQQGSGVGGSALKAIVENWAPEVRKFGLHCDNPNIQAKFRCFGDKELEKLYVTSSPINVASWITQVRAGFKPKETAADLETLDFTNREIPNFKELQQAIIQRFDPNSDKPLIEGLLYPMIDQEGHERTVSMHPAYKTPKYHFIYKLM